MKGTGGIPEAAMAANLWRSGDCNGQTAGEMQGHELQHPTHQSMATASDIQQVVNGPITSHSYNRDRTRGFSRPVVNTEPTASPQPSLLSHPRSPLPVFLMYSTSLLSALLHKGVAVVPNSNEVQIYDRSPSGWVLSDTLKEASVPPPHPTPPPERDLPPYTRAWILRRFRGVRFELRVERGQGETNALCRLLTRKGEIHLTRSVKTRDGRTDLSG